MNNNSKPFLKPAVILTVCLVVVCIRMPHWGAGQIVVVILIGLLTAAQWALFLYLRK